MTGLELMETWRKWVNEANDPGGSVPSARIGKHFRLHWEAFARECGESEARLFWLTKGALNPQHSEKSQIDETISRLKNQLLNILKKPVKRNLVHSASPSKSNPNASTFTSHLSEPIICEVKARLKENTKVVNKSSHSRKGLPATKSKKKSQKKLWTSPRSLGSPLVQEFQLTNKLLEFTWKRIVQWLLEFEKLKIEEPVSVPYSALAPYIHRLNLNKAKSCVVSDRSIETVARQLIRDKKIVVSLVEGAAESFFLRGIGETKKEYGSWSSFRHR